MAAGFRSGGFKDETGNVKKAIDAAKPGALQRAGSFVWTRARQSLKQATSKRRCSERGKPPLLHGANSPLKRLTKFAVDRTSSSVVIGPEKFKSGTAPRVIEEGGSETIKDHGKQVSASFGARPWLGPALAKEVAAGTLPKAWEECLRH